MFSLWFYYYYYFLFVWLILQKCPEKNYYFYSNIYSLIKVPNVLVLLFMASFYLEVDTGWTELDINYFFHPTRTLWVWKNLPVIWIQLTLFAEFRVLQGGLNKADNASGARRAGQVFYGSCNVAFSLWDSQTKNSTQRPK